MVGDSLIVFAMRSLTMTVSVTIFIAEESKAIKSEGGLLVSDYLVSFGVSSWLVSPKFAVTKLPASLNLNQNLQTLQDSAG